MFVHVPGILHVWRHVLLIATTGIPEVHFFQLFHTFEFDQKNYGIDLVLLQLLHSRDVDIEETVLIVADDVIDRPQCCALKMTSPFLIVNENIVRDTLNITNINSLTLLYVRTR